ncbi:MAG: hypothetical protein LH606_01665 [Cytophagaceae bacterium]|nr:hypothetical protein [Cytophagaceae bacterium]
MKTYFQFFLLLTLVFLAGCKRDELNNINFEDVPTGAYVRTITSSGTLSLAALETSAYALTVEAKDEQNGDLLQSYDLTAVFKDNTPANGIKTTTGAALKSIPASAFTKDAKSGLPRTSFTITGAELLAATKVAKADVLDKDAFEITGTVRLTNGKSFTLANSGANLTGPFYNSPFFYRLTVAK